MISVQPSYLYRHDTIWIGRRFEAWEESPDFERERDNEGWRQLKRALAQIAQSARGRYLVGMPPDHPLWRLPNVIMTSHISGSSLSHFFFQRIWDWDIFVQNVARYLEGGPLLNELTPTQLMGG